MNYFVIGGAGFIGSNYTKFLVNKGHRVYVNDDLSTGKAENLEGVNVIWEPNIIKGVMECDYIIHLAASVGVDYVNGNPYNAMVNNIDMERKVFDINKVYKKPLLFASTSEVYGNSPDVPYKENSDLCIGAPSNGRWGYSCSKLMGEFMALHNKFPSVVVRFFNVTGKGQLPDYGMVMPNFVNKAKNNEDIVVYGDGSQVRCFCDVSDAVNMMDMLITSSDCYGQVFNLGNPSNKITMNDLAMRVKSLTNSSSNIIHKPTRNEVDINYRVPHIGKVVGYTGYIPQVGLDDIIKSMV